MGERIRRSCRQLRRPLARISPRLRPHVRHVTVTGEHHVDLGLVQQRQHVASVEHLVSLATGATNWHRVPGTKRSLVLEVADMTGVLIPGHRHHVRTGQRLELLSCLPVLVGVALVGDIPGDHDDVGACIVDFGDPW